MEYSLISFGLVGEDYSYDAGTALIVEAVFVPLTVEIEDRRIAILSLLNSVRFILEGP